MMLLLHLFWLLPSPIYDITGFLTLGATWILALIYMLNVPRYLKDV